MSEDLGENMKLVSCIDDATWMWLDGEEGEEREIQGIMGSPSAAELYSIITSQSLLLPLSERKM